MDIHPSSSPLAGKTILVTRSAGQSSQFSDRLTYNGARVIEMPTLEIGPPSSWRALDQAIADLKTFHWLILTSTNGVDYFFARLNTLKIDIQVLAQIKIAVVGEKTAQSLQQKGLQPDFIPPNFVADSLAEHFPELLAGKKILFPRVESGGREVLVKELAVKGAEVIEVPTYESCCPQNISPDAEFALINRTIDVITFASSKTVKFFAQITANIQSLHSETYLEGVCLASIGPQTSKTCYEIFGRVDVEAEEYTLEGLTQALINWNTRT